MNRRDAGRLLLSSPLFMPSLLRAAASGTGADPSALLETIRSTAKLPALAVVVSKDGAVCEKAAVGVRKQGDPTPVTMHDRFHIGSCTKAMTATLAAMFVEEGKLRWDTRITEALPELQGKVHADFEAVTLEMLLQHRGGLATAALPSAWKRAWEKDGTPTRQRAEFIAAVLAREPAFKPGTKFNYSNQGYAVVGAMIEKLAGSPWETLMAERIFRPLEMKTAGFGAPGAAGKVEEPWGHTIKAGKNDPSHSDNPPSIGPGGTVHCSMEDLSRFTRMHLRRGRDGGQLKPDYFRRLHTPPEGQDYACGWSSLDRGWAGGKALTHNGSNTMWFVVMWLAPERDFSVVVGTNVAGTAATKACDDVAAAMIGKWLPR